MNSIMDFFSNLFSPVVNILGSVLTYFHYDLGVPWWLSIVFLTVIVRTLLFPLTVRQVRSMRAMQDLKPEMDKIRAKFRDNRQKQQEEIMKLYQERGVNPLGGCLPIVVQMPVFIGIFYVIRSFGGTPGVSAPSEPSFREGGILWFQDLSHMDPLFILPVVSALTMLAATEITAKNVEPQQRWLMRILPIGVTIFLWKFPAGLFVYWITSNLVTLTQNYIIYNHGPGKKKPLERANPGANKESSSAESRNGAKSAGTSSQNGNGYSESDETESHDAAQAAARAAKRKRRKKKK